jgi:hypothetical protein
LRGWYFPVEPLVFGVLSFNCITSDFIEALKLHGNTVGKRGKKLNLEKK